MIRNFTYFGIVYILLLSGCIERKVVPDISSVDIQPIDIKRYDEALFNLGTDNLKASLDSIYPYYSFFLGDNYSDTLNLIRIDDFLSDPTIHDLRTEVEKEYSNLSILEDKMTEAFRYLKYYFPEITIPRVYSYISGLYYEAPVEYFDSVLIISLDLYLGEDFVPYRSIGLPKYATRRMNAGHILPDCMKQIGISLMPENLPERTLLDHMILHGKLLYFLDLVLPGYPDSAKIGFSEDELAWCRENDSKIWSLFLENELLYSTDTFVINKFIQDGPFTTGLPEESPAMIGRWIGWKIIRTFIKVRDEVSVKDLFTMSDSQLILTQSRYKPSR